MRNMNMFDNSIDAMLTNAVARATDITTKSIKGRYGFSFNVTSSGMGSLAIEKINKWIKKYDPKYNERVNEMNPNLHDTTFIVPLETNTFLFVSAGRSDYNTAEVIRYMMSDNKGNYGSSSTDLFLYIFGKKAKKYKNEVDYELSKIASSLYVYNVSGGSNERGGRDEFNSIVSDMHQRQIDTLFFDKGVKESIVNHIDQFLANSYIYKERDLLYKTGILLYGKPGTGKSSLANALATKYKSSLIIIDMGTFAYLDTVALSQSINADNERYVILLEDIDCIFNSLNREADGKVADEDERKVINKFLQFLDSNSSPNNVIFIATTNHKEELDATFDEAILRAGRFDLKQEINGICRDVAEEMCKSFNMKDEDIKEILDKESYPINQSHLQNLILQNMTGKEMIDTEEE